MKSARNHHAGLAAEASVLREYLDHGWSVLTRRFRGTRGEIDLVLGKGEQVLFVEVKKSRSHDAALARLGAAQIARITATAAEFLGRMPKGQLTDARFDVALVDAHGQVSILENALA